MNRKWWVYFLAAFLIMYAVLILTNFNWVAAPYCVAAAAIGAGVLLLLDR